MLCFKLCFRLYIFKDSNTMPSKTFYLQDALMEDLEIAVQYAGTVGDVVKAGIDVVLEEAGPEAHSIRRMKTCVVEVYFNLSRQYKLESARLSANTIPDFGNLYLTQEDMETISTKLLSYLCLTTSLIDLRGVKDLEFDTFPTIKDIDKFYLIDHIIIILHQRNTKLIVVF